MKQEQTGGRKKEEGEWVDGEEEEEKREVGERAAWRLKKEAAGLVMDNGPCWPFRPPF